MRLIDADALVARWKAAMLHMGKLEGVHPVGMEAVIEDVKNRPTIDAVPVVRCKDCVQWHRHCGIVDSPNGHCFTHDIEMNGYDFCSFGERKDDA